MKTFVVQEKVSFSLEEKIDKNDDSHISSFGYLFASFFKSAKTDVDFKMYDNMEIKIIDNEYSLLESKKTNLTLEINEKAGSQVTQKNKERSVLLYKKRKIFTRSIKNRKAHIE